MASAILQFDRESIATDAHHDENVQELTELIARDSPRFRRIAFCHLHNLADAEDAVQDAFLSALAHMHQFKGHAKMSTWLTTIIINSARMKLRRRSAQLQISLEEQSEERSFSSADMVSDTRLGPEEMYRNQEIAETLAVATFQLSPILHKTFQLRDVQGFTTRETARALGVPTGTIKARLTRARASLRQMIGNTVQEGIRQTAKGPLLS